MPHNTDGRPSFDPDNRAYQRLRSLAAEHFTVVTWTRADGLPVATSLIDIASGDTITVALIDSHEIRQPHALLAVSTAVAITAHGPFDGHTAADSYAPHLALADDHVAATRPIPLHHPDQTMLADLVWVTIPEQLADGLRAAHAATRGHALLLLDRGAGKLAAIGPYLLPATARAWALRAALPPGVESMLIPLTPPAPHIATH